MRHRMAHRKLGRTTSHRIALLRNLASALIERERIRTTLGKAKELRPFAEKLITLSKREGDSRLAARRQAAEDIHNPTLVKKLFDTLGTRYATRPGGYTRILRLGPRKGDGAEMAIVELLGSEFKPGGKTDDKKADEVKPAAPAAKKKAAPKAKADKAEGGEPKKKAAPRKKKADAGATE
jgi:large subunit ribosomal protein L17